MALNIPIDDDLKDAIKERAIELSKKTGSKTVAVYIRHLIIQDLEKAKKGGK